MITCQYIISIPIDILLQYSHGQTSIINYVVMIEFFSQLLRVTCLYHDNDGS